MAKDFRHYQATAFVTNGCSNHSDKSRQDEDYYATPPSAVLDLLDKESFTKDIYEPFVGGGHIAKVFQEKGFSVKGADIVDRGWEGTEIIDFLKCKETPIDADIVSNPPYAFVKDCWEKSCRRVTSGHKVAFLLKLTFLEGQSRKEMFKKYPPSRIWVYSKRIAPAMNGEFEKYKTSAIAYAWFVYESGNVSLPVVDWI